MKKNLIGIVVSTVFLVSLITCVSAASAQNVSPTYRSTPQFSFTPKELLFDQWLRRQSFVDQLQTFGHWIGEVLKVPYVWGGSSLGSPEVCSQCQECITKNRVPARARLSRCSACRQCGLDCSHFVSLAFNQQGIPSKYASTHTLLSASNSALHSDLQLNVVDGHDLSNARPGDLIVYSGHLGILLAKQDKLHGDLMHLSRYSHHAARVGGIRVDRGLNLTRKRGGIRRILRHRQFIDPEFNSGRYSFYAPAVTPQTLGPRRPES